MKGNYSVWHLDEIIDFERGDRRHQVTTIDQRDAMRVITPHGTLTTKYVMENIHDLSNEYICFYILLIKIKFDR